MGTGGHPDEIAMESVDYWRNLAGRRKERITTLEAGVANLENQVNHYQEQLERAEYAAQAMMPKTGAKLVFGDGLAWLKSDGKDEVKRFREALESIRDRGNPKPGTARAAVCVTISTLAKIADQALAALEAENNTKWKS